ncbi:BTAD domain-containing putative transcriptional regulator [Lentzea sp. JNUCC 0626]|uniref:AfsR/SARP family transcriptional regulator n=1 Tax=Lentzea sp. JNUCC 0626 TaxID=3367513 RepID=UPI0037486582
MEFKILGPLEVWAPTGRIVVPGVKRQVVLAALLLAAGRPAALDRLVDAVWGAQPPPSASKQIRNAVSDLRTLLGGTALCLTPAGSHYRLEFDATRLDSAQFTRHVAEARRLRAAGCVSEAAAEFRVALRLWRADALADLASPVLQAQVVGLNQQRLSAFEECVDLELALGRHRELVGELSALVAEHPQREPLVARLMTAHVRSGAVAAALHVYEATRRRLKDDLGANPSVQLRQLHLRILSGEAEVPAEQAVPDFRGAAFAPCNTLPPAAPVFAGRTAEIGRVVETARDHDPALAGGPAVVLVDGMAGIGKTALAVHAAHLLASAYPEAQLFVDLSAHALTGRPADPLDVLGTLLRAVGVPASRIPASLADRCGLWRLTTSGRKMVLLLDDARNAEQVAPLVPGAPGSLVVVTSRSPLAGLDGTCHIALGELTPGEGRDLFARVLSDARPHAEPEAVDELLKLCGRHPQAVRLAAAKLRHRPDWTVGDLVRRLAERTRMLAELRAVEAGLAGALDRSLQRLSKGQQHVFRLLWSVPGPHVEVREMAELVRCSEEQAERLLEGLAEAALLAPAAPGSYRIHAVVHAFAAQLGTRETTIRSVHPVGAPA